LNTVGNGEVRLGENAGSHGNWNLSAGTASTDGVRVGWSGGGIGQLTVSSNGTLNTGFVNIAEGGVGTVTQTGGAINVTGNFDIQASTGNAGTFSLSGGVLAVNGIISTDNGTFTFTGGKITRSNAGVISFSDGLATAAPAATLELDANKTFAVGTVFDKHLGITLNLTGDTLPVWSGIGNDTGSIPLGTDGSIIGTFDPAQDSVTGLNNLAGATFISETAGEGTLYNPSTDSVYWVQENAGAVTLNYNIVPEPAAFATLFGGATMLLALRRFRRRA